MPSHATRFHVELDLDMVCPPSDDDVRKIIYNALDNLKFIRYHKCRNLKIRGKKTQNISNDKRTKKTEDRQ